MIRLGITGGMGSGKSVVCELLRLHDIPVYDADKEAKLLNDTSPKIQEGLSRAFGDTLYAEGKLNRKMLAKLIFNDDQKLAKANSIIHPVLAESFIAWCRERAHHPIVAIDAAVLLEAGFEQHVDHVLMVFAEKETRVQRVIERDGASRALAEARMQHQIPEEEKIQRADFVIYNDGRLSLIQQVTEILMKL